MNILMLLEHLANTTHNQVKISEVLANQPQSVKNAFSTNNSADLKSLLGETNNLADRSAVTQLII